MANKNVELDPKKRPDYIARGSDQHKALLGLSGNMRMSADEQAAREEALAATKPEPSAGPEKLPVNRQNYDRDEVVFDGWARRSS